MVGLRKEQERQLMSSLALRISMFTVPLIQRQERILPYSSQMLIVTVLMLI
jgi:hypothetical protein